MDLPKVNYVDILSVQLDFYRNNKILEARLSSLQAAVEGIHPVIV